MVSHQPVTNAPELGPPILNVAGERVALGPLRRDLLPAYQRWANDLSAAERLALLPQPVTLERQTAWYEQAATATDRLAFTIYETATWQAIGTCGLNEVDHRQGVAYLAILIGVAEGGPPIFTLSPSEARGVLDRLQSGHTAMAPAEVEPTPSGVGLAARSRL